MINVGDTRRMSVTFTNVAGVVADPTTVRLLVKKPGGSTVTYTYLVGIVIVKDGVGSYHADFSLDTAGEWLYEWQGTGAVEVAEGSSFYVYPSMV